MKKKIILKRIFHRDKWRLAICFDFDANVKARVQALPGCAFSGTHRCFYIDDTEENLRLIISDLKDLADIDISAISWKESRAEVKQTVTVTSLQDPQKSRAGSGQSGNNIRYGPVEFRINEKEGLLVIRFLGYYDREWIREMKSYDGLKFDQKRLEWLLPWSKLTTDSLADYFGGKGIRVNVIRTSVNDELLERRKTTGNEIRSKEIGDRAREGLEMLEWYLDDNRYSPRTRESYVAMLEFFFRYFSPREPGEISEDEISKFLYDFIIKLGYSAAYQNQMVSAIKTFYAISGIGKIRPDFLARPRKSRALPKVFSKEEVSLILNSARNMKHKLILWMIYSCGLRRSEVTNIRLNDLDRDRSILHIREGKGKVDRIVPVSDKVWQKVDEYLSGYKPKSYLFEGQGGGRYSSESVYRIFKDALIKAGIKKEVGVHSLRHSYATHLHENGLDIRYIQELLGHKSTRTTEIYTHVSRRNLVAVRSPIEDLDVK